MGILKKDNYFYCSVFQLLYLLLHYLLQMKPAKTVCLSVHVYTY